MGSSVLPVVSASGRSTASNGPGPNITHLMKFLLYSLYGALLPLESSLKPSQCPLLQSPRQTLSTFGGYL